MSINVAKEHLSNDPELFDKVKYQQTSIEELLKEEKYHNHFDFATSMEVIEHVMNPEEFVKNINRSVKPGGLIFMSTIARTLQSWALTIKLAEDITGMVPKGTHDWDKFLNPEEVHEMLTDAG